MAVVARVKELFGDPVFLRRFHGWATIFWVVMAVPSIVWWHSSIPYLVGLSVYAVVTGHWSSWQASRAEVKIDDAAEVDIDHSNVNVANSDVKINDDCP